MSRSWPLPRAAHVPGRTARPDTSPAYEAARAAPDPTDPDAWRANATYLYGVDLYTAGYFWEAHEAWEPVWANARQASRERALAQGLIQLANACLKLRMERGRAARRLLAIAADHFAAAGPAPVMGLSPTALVEAIAGFDARLAGGNGAPADRPKLVPA